MSRTVWKFPVRLDGFTLAMPRGARILSVGTQPEPMDPNAQMQWDTNAHPRLWALVDPDAPVVVRRLACVGTGHPLPEEIDGFAFVGTFQMHGGRLVFHLFDGGEVLHDPA